MLRESEYHGAFGLTMFGIAALDTALWDALGKTLGVPCWQLETGSIGPESPLKLVDGSVQIPTGAGFGW